MSKGPKGPSPSDGNESIKAQKFMINVFIILIVIGFTAGGFWGGIFFKEKHTIIPEPEIIEKTVEKEVIHYVERSKTETTDFLLYLNPDVDPALAKIIADDIDEMSEKYQLPRKLVCSIIKKESNINPFAKSKVGAVGLMQVMPKIHKDKIGDRNLWHLKTNVDVGCSIFREYLDLEKGNMYKTFHRYLSKNATKEQIEEYSSDIYENWARLEMFDYMSIEERKATEDGKDKIEEVLPEQPINETTNSKEENNDS